MRKLKNRFLLAIVVSLLLVSGVLLPSEVPGLANAEVGDEPAAGGEPVHAVQTTETASLELLGAVMGHNTTSPSQLVERVQFQVRADGGPVDLFRDAIIVTYMDDDQALNLPFTINPRNSPGWGRSWLIGSGPMLDPGEVVELTVNLTGLAKRLGTYKEFTIQVKSVQGAVLTVNGRTPPELTAVVDLQARLLRGMLEIRSAVVTNNATTTQLVNNVVFQVGTATFEAVDLADVSLIVTYIDEDQAVNIAMASVNRSWLLGTGDLLDPYERVQFQVDLTGLTTRLGPSRYFTIQVKPNLGGILTITRRTPPELTTVVDLDQSLLQAAPVLSGSVVGIKNPTRPTIDTIKFQAINPSQSLQPVDLSDTGVAVSYIDKNQSANLFPSAWEVLWLVGMGPLLDPGERVEFYVDLTGLSVPLGPSQEFTIEVKPNLGLDLTFTRTTPEELAPIVIME